MLKAGFCACTAVWLLPCLHNVLHKFLLLKVQKLGRSFNKGWHLLTEQSIRTELATSWPLFGADK